MTIVVARDVVWFPQPKLDAFKYAVKHHYWYQMYLDDMPMWALVGDYGESHTEEEKEVIDVSKSLTAGLHLNAHERVRGRVRRGCLWGEIIKASGFLLFLFFILTLTRSGGCLSHSKGGQHLRLDAQKAGHWSEWQPHCEWLRIVLVAFVKRR